MKKITFLAVCMLLRIVCFAQDSKINKSYVTKTSVVVNPYNYVKDSIDTSMHFLLNDGVKFYIYKVLDNGYVISVWDFEETDEKINFLDSITRQKKALNEFHRPKNNEYYRMSKNDAGLSNDKVTNPDDKPLAKYSELAYVDFWGNNAQFFIPLKSLNDNCETIYPATRSFTWGFLTLPIKMRFGNSKEKFTFEEKINFGLSFGIKFQRPTTMYTAHNLLVGVSIANVKTVRVIESDLITTSEEESAAALSFSGGYMYQYDMFQIGAFLGFDFVGGNQSSQFSYQGKPWLGLAIGVSLFSENKMSAEPSNSPNVNK